MVIFWGCGFVGVFDVVVKIVENVIVIIDGQLIIEVKVVGEFVGVFEVFDVVIVGQVDMYYVVDYYFVN